MPRRLSRHINITVDERLLARVDEQVNRYSQTRSGLIRLALLEWLAEHAIIPSPTVYAVNGRPYKPGTLLTDYTGKGDAPEVYLQTLKEWEAARRALG